MPNPLYPHSSIVDREVPPLPEGKSVAFWIGLNIEHYLWGQQALSLAPFTAELVPDPLNYGWRDYGPRVGFWRIAEILDRYGVRASGILNSDVCDEYPELVAAGVERDWAWIGHGTTNSRWQVGFEPEEEDAYVVEVADRIERAAGVRPRGWLGPALTATMHTNDALAKGRYDYVLDWANDDLPYDMNVSEGRLLSMPYSSEVNDIPIFQIHHQTGEGFLRAMVDQFDVLREEGQRGTPRVMGVGLHPFLIGQPFRSKYLAMALEHICAADDVWLATSDEIADWYLGAAQA